MGYFTLHDNTGGRMVKDTIKVNGKKYRLYSRNHNSRDAKEDVRILHDRGINAVIRTYSRDPMYYVFKN